ASTVGASFSQDNNSSGVSQDSIWAGLRIFFSPCPIYHYSTFDVKLVSYQVALIKVRKAHGL
ncbi:MAG: hypothetical protein KKD99_11290, partial [Proteobacteria bacterium]|nr:hypothetical protein [Pseudomonadota bacterium]